MRLRLEINWQLQDGDNLVAVSDTLFKLLQAIAEGCNLRQAAQLVEVSYRNAWGQIAEWENRFRTQLVVSERGRGTRLTKFAEQLLATKTRINADMRAPLDSAADAASGRLTRMLGSDATALRLVSSDHMAVNKLASELKRAANRRVVLDVIGSESALRRYQRHDADVVGFHIPRGKPFYALAKQFSNWLDDSRDEIYQLQERRIGLVYPSHVEITKLSSLTEPPTPKFINRQPGSATRRAIDILLSEDGIDQSSIDGYGDEEHTHTAVAARVASGEREVGIADEDVLNRFNLHFLALFAECFYIALKRELQTDIKQEILSILNKSVGEPLEQVSVSEILHRSEQS
ncbi:MAG: substrate-binding domain-containing protein [Pseudomonadota bacterium]